MGRHCWVLLLATAATVAGCTTTDCDPNGTYTFTAERTSGDCDPSYQDVLTVEDTGQEWLIADSDGTSYNGSVSNPGRYCELTLTGAVVDANGTWAVQYDLMVDGQDGTITGSAAVTVNAPTGALQCSSDYAIDGSR